MHAGLIPIVSVEASVDVEDEYGIVLKESSVDQIKWAVDRLTEMSIDKLVSMSRKAWEHVRANHTRERFAEVYRDVVGNILEWRGLRTNYSQQKCRPNARA
jgi:hypothetical protein